MFWLLPRKSQVNHPGVLDLHAAEEERAWRTEGLADVSEESHTISYSIYLYSCLDDCFYHKATTSCSCQFICYINHLRLLPKHHGSFYHGSPFTDKAKEGIKVYRWWFNSSCSYQIIVSTNYLRLWPEHIKTTMDHPSFTDKTKKRQMVYNCWWYNRSNNTSQIQDLSPDRC